MSNQYIIFAAFCACLCRAFGAMGNNLGGDTNRNTKKINLKEMKISISGRCPFSLDGLSAFSNHSKVQWGSPSDAAARFAYLWPREIYILFCYVGLLVRGWMDGCRGLVYNFVT